MVYMGSKNRIAKQLLTIIDQYLMDDTTYVEPFVGGCNMIDKVNHPHRIAADCNRYLIALWQGLQEGRTIYNTFDSTDYITCRELSNNGLTSSKYDAFMIGCVGCLSFSGKYFGGYIDLDKEGERAVRGQRCANIIAQIPKIQNIEFRWCNYWDLTIPPNSVIYCDPPYTNTSKYTQKSFSHIHFWQWVRERHYEGHKVFVSEYQAPEDFVPVLTLPITTNIGRVTTDTAVEKLFTLF
jgi:DNA adenine methylase